MSSFARPLVISGPSGTGKSTLLSRLFDSHPDKFGFSVSHTTRSPRAGEEDGKAYHFVDRDGFLGLRSAGGFIETAEFAGNFYGTSKLAVKKVHDDGRRCILDIEAQGVRQIKDTDLNPVYLFISPPDMVTLTSRLRGRGSDEEIAIQKRLRTAIQEIQYAKTGAHDIVIVNDDLDRAYAKFEKVALGQDVESDTLPPLLDE
ncbi:guanylate kinase [Phellopilus nigrolimitatus]|nr:guanylate kinase [Phellopilus nigrolimitatus]